MLKAAEMCFWRRVVVGSRMEIITNFRIREIMKVTHIIVVLSKINN